MATGAGGPSNQEGSYFGMPETQGIAQPSKRSEIVLAPLILP